MNVGRTIFGTIDQLTKTSIESGLFRFCLAEISLNGRAWTSPLSDVALRHNEHSPLTERDNAHWVRGRLHRLFGVTEQSNNLEIESRVDDETFADRLMLKVSFAAETHEHETNLYIPFICTETFSEACLIHGAIPERNADRYQRLLASMTHAFVSLLLRDNLLSDYDDYSVIFGTGFSFGVRNAVPYNNFPGTQR